MPPRKRDDTLTPRQFASSMELMFPNLQISDGAMEALRIAHGEFLDLVASELASKEDRVQKILQPRDVQECLTRLGFSHLYQETTKVPIKSKKRKRFQVNQDMVAQQEKLLEQSRRTVQAQRQENDSKPAAK